MHKTDGMHKSPCLCFAHKQRMKSVEQALLNTDVVIQRQMVLKVWKQFKPIHLALA